MRLLFALSFIFLFHPFDFRIINKKLTSTTTTSTTTTTTEAPPLTSTAEAEDDIEPMTTTPAVVAPPDCSKDCYIKLKQSLRTALDASAGDFVKRYETICKQYDEALLCYRGRESCPSNANFPALTSGLNFMCIEQRAPFEDNLPCVRNAFGEVTTDCQGRCNINALAAGVAMREMLRKDFKFLDLMDSQMLQIGMQETCRLSNCFIGCYKTKLDFACNGVGGSLVAEAVLRPFSYPELNAGEYISESFRSFIPQQCNFLSNKQELDRLRMDPKLIEQLNEKYATTTAAPTVDSDLVNVTSVSNESMSNVTSASPVAVKA